MFLILMVSYLLGLIANIYGLGYLLKDEEKAGLGAYILIPLWPIFWPLAILFFVGAFIAISIIDVAQKQRKKKQ